MNRLINFFGAMLYVLCFSGCIQYPIDDDFDDSKTEEPTAQVKITNGALPGKFSVSNLTTIQFSQGNLQYLPATNTWRFAVNQWDYIGDANKFISPSSENYIDLFGWGTGKNPTNTSSNNYDYEFIDWGVNSISNGGNRANMWRTLTSNEWDFLCTGRTNAASLIGTGTVNRVFGLILLPDSWTQPSNTNILKNSGNSYDDYSWKKMEAAGAVFLPAGGYRSGTTINNYNSSGYYWSSSHYNSSNSYDLYFYSGSKSMDYHYKSRGHSVRLVR